MRTDKCIYLPPPPTPLKKMMVIGMVGVRGCLWADQLFFSQSKCDDKWVSSTLSGVSGPPTGNPLHPWAIPFEGKKRMLMLTSAENKANTLVCKVQAIIYKHECQGLTSEYQGQWFIYEYCIYAAAECTHNVIIHTGCKTFICCARFWPSIALILQHPEWLLCFGVWVKMFEHIT